MWRAVEASAWGADSEVRKVWLTTLRGPVAPSAPASAPLSLNHSRTPRLTPARSTWWDSSNMLPFWPAPIDPHSEAVSLSDLMQELDSNGSRGGGGGDGSSGVGKRWLHSLDHYRRLKDEDPIIPFSEGPIISKWGAISRASRTGYHTTDPVQATACQGSANTTPINFRGTDGSKNGVRGLAKTEASTGWIEGERTSRTNSVWSDSVSPVRQ